MFSRVPGPSIPSCHCWLRGCKSATSLDCHFWGVTKTLAANGLMLTSFPSSTCTRCSVFSIGLYALHVCLKRDLPCNHMKFKDSWTISDQQGLLHPTWWESEGCRGCICDYQSLNLCVFTRSVSLRSAILYVRWMQSFVSWSHWKSLSPCLCL